MPVPVLFLLACGTPPTEPATTPPTSEVTWHDDIAPIVANHCAKLSLIHI